MPKRRSWVTDQDDDLVAEAALLARATHIVTGDRRIHAVTLAGVAVVAPAVALQAVADQDQRGRAAEA